MSIRNGLLEQILTAVEGASGSGGGSGSGFDYLATNYTNLTTTVAPTAAESALAYVFNSQGIVDLDRKVKGVYIYQSGSWIYGNQELQTAMDSNRIALNNFISDISNTVRGTSLTGFTTSFNSAVTSSNTVIQAMGRLQAQINDAKKWQPNQTSLRDYTNSNTLIHSGLGVGELRAFPAVIVSKLAGSFPLHNNGKEYDGSNIEVSIDWALYNPPSGGHTVKWQLEYYFSTTGDTPYSATPITSSITVSVTGGTINTQRNNVFPVISGVSGKKLLHIGIKRLGDSDTYTSDANLSGITFKRV